MNALKNAIKITGSQKSLAEKLNVTQQCVSKWLKSGMPASKAIMIEKATDGAVKRQELRPDLYND